MTQKKPRQKPKTIGSTQGTRSRKAGTLPKQETQRDLSTWGFQWVGLVQAYTVRLPYSKVLHWNASFYSTVKKKNNRDSSWCQRIQTHPSLYQADTLFNNVEFSWAQR